MSWSLQERIGQRHILPLSEHNHLLVQPEIAVDKPSHSHHKSILFTSCIDCNSIHLELIIESHIFLLIKVSHGDFQLV